ncbi:hypothetical protein CH63R_09319 [Colletotrichum higginsianum IMI 349063]|uniref:Uncharacterized protein n=1 Tax=Colletotrichum higginsianum (strain IMI 349063) TaxID=759273 RepID=A0A1B7Y7B1_COLHI|nr:hypothetical protein CH63R_09319 [Colletotrichum higginsianum IMI 349063]OBR07798.1 hypothetical protein CH63R_09319 [Colletotrichum higginsianum IMI 349063]
MGTLQNSLWNRLPRHPKPASKKSLSNKAFEDSLDSVGDQQATSRLALPHRNSRASHTHRAPHRITTHRLFSPSTHNHTDNPPHGNSLEKPQTDNQNLCRIQDTHPDPPRLIVAVSTSTTTITTTGWSPLPPVAVHAANPKVDGMPCLNNKQTSLALANSPKLQVPWIASSNQGSER